MPKGVYLLVLTLFAGLCVIPDRGEANQCEIFYTLDSAKIEKNGNTYKENQCSDNVICLGRQLVSGGMDADKLFVLILQSNNHRAPIVPHNLDSGMPRSYRFHAVVEYKNSIFDFDSHDKGKPAEMRKYFSTHFPMLAEQPINVQRIPFGEYIKLKGLYGHAFSFIVQGNSRYREGSIESYLKSKSLVGIVPAKINFIRKWYARLKYFSASQSNSPELIIRNYIISKGIGGNVTLPVYDLPTNRFNDVRGNIVEYTDYVVTLKISNGENIPIPYHLVDSTEFSVRPGY